MLKVFLVEDECVVREGLRDCIDWERYGFEFCGDAPDGELALPQIRKLRPDILITDIKMPFMDGWHSASLSAQNCRRQELFSSADTTTLSLRRRPLRSAWSSICLSL